MEPKKRAETPVQSMKPLNQKTEMFGATNKDKERCMLKRYRVAAVQLDSQNNKMINLEAVCRYVDEAAAQGAKLIVFPEDMNLVGRNIGEGGNAEEIPGITSVTISNKAKEHGVYILAGSFREIIHGEKRYYNTSLLVNPDGEICGRYHKIHTFDITLSDGTLSRESARICPGDSIITENTELGCIGMSICYDIRFPELYRLMALVGAQIFLVPADFTDDTGKVHWETLLRARAIENGCYVIAANQTGMKPTYKAHGNSMIIDPWGKILTRADDSPEIIYAEIDLDYLEQVRTQIPSLKNRREEVYSLWKINH